MDEPLRCADCGAIMVRRTGNPSGGAPRRFWGCSTFPKCRGTHGAHQRTGEPLGVPADAETRAARRRAHLAFDQLWRGGSMTRPAAYEWLRTVMAMTKDDAHIARFTLADCERLESALAKRRNERQMRRQPERGAS